MRTRLALWCYVVAVSFVVGCATARHAAVVADLTFAQAVFAVDDAERQACMSGVLTPAQCADANPKITHALEDVGKVTAALKATPKTAAVPQNLPDLLADLTVVQGIVGPLEGSSPLGQLAKKVNTALLESAKLLQAITKGP